MIVSCSHEAESELLGQFLSDRLRTDLDRRFVSEQNDHGFTWPIPPGPRLTPMIVSCSHEAESELLAPFLSAKARASSYCNLLMNL